MSIKRMKLSVGSRNDWSVSMARSLIAERIGLLARGRLRLMRRPVRRTTQKRIDG